jgi:hypothetical protein
MVQVPTRFSFDFVQIFSLLFKDLLMIFVENSNIFPFFAMPIKNNMRITSGTEWTALLIMKFSCTSLPPSSTNSIKLAQRKDSKQRIGYGCIYHFFTLQFLYADTDRAESKIDGPTVAIIRMISILSMRFIPITS